MTWRTYIAKKFAKCTRVYLAPRNLKQVPGAIGVIEHIYAWPPGRAHNHDIWGGAQFIPRGFSHIIVGSPPCKQVLWELNLNPHESAWHVWRFKSSQGYGEVARSLSETRRNLIFQLRGMIPAQVLILRTNFEGRCQRFAWYCHSRCVESWTKCEFKPVQAQSFIQHVQRSCSSLDLLDDNLGNWVAGNDLKATPGRFHDKNSKLWSSRKQTPTLAIQTVLEGWLFTPAVIDWVPT